MRGGKFSIHVLAQWANCQGNYEVNSSWLPARQKAEGQVCKKKVAKNIKLSIKAIVKQKIVDEEKYKVEKAVPNLYSNIWIDNKNKKAVQGSKKANLGLIMENNDWATNSVSSFLLI